MSVVRVGSNEKYATNWDKIFSGGKSTKSTKKAKSASKSSPKSAKKAAPVVKKTKQKMAKKK